MLSVTCRPEAQKKKLQSTIPSCVLLKAAKPLSCHTMPAVYSACPRCVGVEPRLEIRKMSWRKQRRHVMHLSSRQRIRNLRMFERAVPHRGGTAAPRLLLFGKYFAHGVLDAVPRWTSGLLYDLQRESLVRPKLSKWYIAMWANSVFRFVLQVCELFNSQLKFRTLSRDCVLALAGDVG